MIKRIITSSLLATLAACSVEAEEPSMQVLSVQREGDHRTFEVELEHSLHFVRRDGHGDPPSRAFTTIESEDEQTKVFIAEFDEFIDVAITDDSSQQWVETSLEELAEIDPTRARIAEAAIDGELEDLAAEVPVMRAMNSGGGPSGGSGAGGSVGDHEAYDRCIDQCIDAYYVCRASLWISNCTQRAEWCMATCDAAYRS